MQVLALQAQLIAYTIYSGYIITSPTSPPQYILLSTFYIWKCKARQAFTFTNTFVFIEIIIPNFVEVIKIVFRSSFILVQISNYY